MEHHQHQIEETPEIQVQEDSQILLFYVDENGETAQNVLTTVEHVEDMENMEIDGMQEETMETEQTYYIEEGGDDEPDEDLLLQYNPEEDEPWDPTEIKRLLIFYVDNKETFNNGLTRKKVLWSVACKTMVTGRTPAACEMQLVTLRNKFTQIILNHKNGSTISWPYLELAHRAFHDDAQVQADLTQHVEENPSFVSEPQEDFKVVIENPGDIIVEVPPLPPPQQEVNTFPCTKKKPVPPDEKVVQMLQLYIKHRARLNKFQKTMSNKCLWENIVLEMGEKDTEYWHHRFMNFKMHYIRLLDKKMEKGDKADITWPYMEYYDQIFLEDPDFRKKYVTPNQKHHIFSVKPTVESPKELWNNAEITVLVKYYFDCYSEFQDRTIPNNFLWNEVGRLLDKNASACQSKFTELREEHIKSILDGQYDFIKRKPVQILFDNVISRDVANELSTVGKHEGLRWTTEQINKLVQFVHENMIMFKDIQGYFVLWSVLAVKFKTSIASCVHKWTELRTLYKCILDDKKDDPEMPIEWKFIEPFDRIFDYGMDTKLLTGYENLNAKPMETEENGKEQNSDQDNYKDDDFDPKGYKPRSKNQEGEEKAFKILEYYQKHKDKFSNNPRKKQVVWEDLAKKIGLTAFQCGHRLRNLKQVFTGYVEKEITRPDLPIVWPYYNLCKKVFGYQAVKKRLKSKLAESDDEDWTPKEMKQLIIYLSSKFNEISGDDSNEKWTELAQQIKKSESSCRDKFLELRKSYRKLRTMQRRNPQLNVTWKYFPLMHEIYSSGDGKGNIEALVIADDEGDENDDDDDVADDEYQCIIVLPENEDGSNISLNNTEADSSQNAEATDSSLNATDSSPKVTKNSPKKKPATKWTKKTKKLLLTLYIEYVNNHKGEEIIGKDMWKDIAKQIPKKTAVFCKKMFAKLKADRLKDENSHKNTPYYELLEDIIKLKPKFKKVTKNRTEKEYKDVDIPNEIVQKSLEYYLKNVEEFANPRFDKKYAWTDLAKEVNQPLNKIFNKINYLKNNINNEFGDLIKQILEKEESIKKDIGEIKNEDLNEQVDWTDEETEELLVWYLANLDKFKNPKFVRKYLWIEASDILKKSALSCSKQMSEIRTQYRTLVKEKPDDLTSWRFNVLCQKIYGTGKQKS